MRDYMVVVSRMTGYEEDDIYEYLENSFEHIIWDWDICVDLWLTYSVECIIVLTR